MFRGVKSEVTCDKNDMLMAQDTCVVESRIWRYIDFVQSPAPLEA